MYEILSIFKTTINVFDPHVGEAPMAGSTFPLVCAPTVVPASASQLEETAPLELDRRSLRPYNLIAMLPCSASAVSPLRGVVGRCTAGLSHALSSV